MVNGDIIKQRERGRGSKERRGKIDEVLRQLQCNKKYYDSYNVIKSGF